MRAFQRAYAHFLNEVFRVVLIAAEAQGKHPKLG